MKQISLNPYKNNRIGRDKFSPQLIHLSKEKKNVSGHPIFIQHSLNLTIYGIQANHRHQRSLSRLLNVQQKFKSALNSKVIFLLVTSQSIIWNVYKQPPSSLPNASNTGQISYLSLTHFCLIAHQGQAGTSTPGRPTSNSFSHCKPDPFTGLLFGTLPSSLPILVLQRLSQSYRNLYHLQHKGEEAQKSMIYQPILFSNNVNLFVGSLSRSLPTKVKF